MQFKIRVSANFELIESVYLQSYSLRCANKSLTSGAAPERGTGSRGVLVAVGGGP